MANTLTAMPLAVGGGSETAAKDCASAVEKALPVDSAATDATAVLVVSTVNVTVTPAWLSRRPEDAAEAVTLVTVTALALTPSVAATAAEKAVTAVALNSATV